jgi:hypothetical protein
LSHQFLITENANAPKQNNILVFIVMDLLHLIVIKNNKQNVGSKNKLGPFHSHDALEFSLMILIETKHPSFQNLQDEGC